MKFSVSSVSRSGQRLGRITDVRKKPDITINTPAVMLHTQGGQIPHITHEVFKMVSTEPQILQIPLAGMHTFKETLECYEGSIENFIGSKNSLICMTVQDPCNITKHTENATSKVAIWTKNGRVFYDPKCYMDILESVQPDMYFMLSDGDINIASSERRIKKSITNTKKFYDECRERHKNSKILSEAFAIVPLVGGYSIEARKNFLKAILEDDSVADDDGNGGFLIDGLHNNGPEVEFIEFSKVDEVLRAILPDLPKNHLRCVQGCWNPVNILHLIDLGIDLFDTSYCHILTERSAAMTFRFTHVNENPGKECEINLRDSKFVDDFSPISKNCKCLVCSKYTRAYIHHLLAVQELLGPILIQIHNVHHYLAYFEEIRTNIKNNTLQKLQMWIEEQYQGNEVNHKITE